MKRFAILSYGVTSYLVFFAALLYAIGFVGDFVVPRTVDNGVAAPLVEAVVINVGLLALFAIQHSVMARPAFKRWWTRFVPTAVERSTYVLVASLVLFLLYWQWRTMPAVVWDVTTPVARFALYALFWLGWAIMVTSTFMIGHFDLFGLRQVYLAWRGKWETHTGGFQFQSPLLYRLIRHPIMLGFIIAFWAIPTMTAGHLLFAAVTTAYVLIAIQLEERDLVAELGDPYRVYQQRVPMLVPWRRPRGHGTAPNTPHRPAQ